MAEPLLELRGISKSFGSTRALEQVDFRVEPGEVHVLCGENGAGKSTLIRILCGVYDDYAGELRVGGARTRFAGPDDAVRAGIATIHQELSLVEALSVQDNLFLSGQSLFAPISRAREARRTRALLEEFGLDFAPEAPVEHLPLGKRQLLEIARAVSRAARVLVLDEPTSALDDAEAERLFARIRSLRERGVGVVYISHRMQEIALLADRITVLRDGRSVGSFAASELREDALIRAMLGRGLESPVRTPSHTSGAPRLSIEGLGVRARSRSGRALLENVTLAVQPGELVGVAGLAGSGASELLYALFGAWRAQRSGRVLLDGVEFAPADATSAIAQGVVLLPNDRAASVLPDLSLGANLSLCRLRGLSRAGVLELQRERHFNEELLRRVPIAGPGLDAPLGAFSGGNQQKAVLLRCLSIEPRVLLLDEPTRGVDVRAKQEIFSALRRAAAAGAVILWVASDLEELSRESDRVAVLQRGRVRAVLEREDLTRERILGASMGREPAEGEA